MIRVTEPGEDEEIVHVQSVLPSKVVKELKNKTHKTSVKEAVSKAVYHYMNCQELDREVKK